MIHFFPRYAKSIEDTPFDAELRRLGVPYRVFGRVLDRQYRRRLELLYRIYPAWLWLSLVDAVRSLVLSRERPDFVVVTSDVEALVFGMVARLRGGHTRVIFETFIMTPKASPAKRALHQRYYRFVLRFVDAAICHSQLEARDYAARFTGVHTRFLCVPYTLGVARRAALRAETEAVEDGLPVVVAAGRSGRDYKTLAEAAAGLPCRVHIICDWAEPVAGLEGGGQITVLRACFGEDYLRELARAQVVVVPISHAGISAGQMVMLHAFALGKPVVVTDTETMREYATDGVDCVFAAFGDAADLRAKLAGLLADAGRRRALGAAAARSYDERFSVEAYVRNLVGALERLKAPALVS